MAAKVTWSPSSLTDIEDITAYIAADNVPAALRVGQNIIDTANRLAAFPNLGNILRGSEKRGFRELVVGNYRIVYRFRETDKIVIILRVWHAARGEPEIPSH